MKNKKITIIALHLNFGGVEKAIIELANNLSLKYEVEIICTYKMNEIPAFKVSDQVKITYILKNKPNKKEFVEALKKHKFITVLKEGLKSIKILYEKKYYLIRKLKTLKTDVIISTRAFHNKLVGKYIDENVIKIAWEHNHHQNNNKYIKKTLKSVKNMDYFILVSMELLNFYKDKTKAICKYIPNSIEISKNFKHKPENKLIAIGRLESEKGFLDLIDIFKLLNEKCSNYKLTIIGDGSEKSLLENKIKKLKLESKVELKGYLESSLVHKELDTSKLYLMTSLTEAFGIVLIEAMAHGIPCIAFDSANGAKEIIKNNYNGYLIKNRNHNEFREKTIEVLSNKTLYETLSRNALEESKKYDSSIVIKKWENLVESKK